MFNLPMPILIKSFGFLIEYIGVISVIISVFIALFHLPSKKYTRDDVRNEFAKNLIFSLDFIIAADILLVTVANNLNEALQLGVIVVMRVLLATSLRKEISKFKIKSKK